MNNWDHIPLASLNEILANLYPSEAEARRLAAKAGLRTAQIDFSGSSLSRWFNVLYHANPRAKVDDVVARALEEHPDDEALKQAKNRAPPPVVKGPDVAHWAGPVAMGQLEKIIGARSTLVPITYLEIGLIRSRAVVRIKRQDGSSGSGFVTGNNLLITNNHVL